MLFAVPDFPGSHGLKFKHFLSVFHISTAIYPFLQEACDGRIIDKVKKEMVFAEKTVRQLRTPLGFWIGTERGCIDD